MQPVGAIDVRMAGRPEHRGVARGAAVEAMRRRILVVVCLDLDDRAADAVDQQGRADQVRRDVVDAAIEERARQRLRLDLRAVQSSTRQLSSCQLSTCQLSTWRGSGPPPQT